MNVVPYATTLPPDPLVEHLRAEVARLKRERDEALEQERRLWRALVMAKGAAEHLIGAVNAVENTMRSQMSVLGEDLFETAGICSAELERAEKLAGIALED